LNLHFAKVLRFAQTSILELGSVKAENQQVKMLLGPESWFKASQVCHH